MPYDPQLSVKKTLSNTKLIHAALLGGQVVFALFMIWQPIGDSRTTDNDNNLFLSIVTVMGLSGYLVGKIMYKKNVEKAVKRSSLSDKLTAFQSGIITRMALVEGPSLLSLIFYSVTDNVVFLAIGGLHIAYFISIRPRKEKLQKDLHLSDEQMEQVVV